MDGADSNRSISAVKRGLLAREVRQRSADLKILQREPVAIIGMGCRFPGGANSPSAFWRLLKDGVDACREVPSSRWDINSVYDPDPSTPGKVSTRQGGFLDIEPDRFDAEFFGISPREAKRMDPQQRLFAEVAFEAITDAGLVEGRLAGSKTALYIASYYNDYAQLQYGDVTTIDAYTISGTAHSIIPNRLSFLLDLRGPSISIDTACSSSLVAVHLACQSLRWGESDIALAGGVSLMLTPEVTVSLSKWGFLAPDGRCKTFDAAADGFVRGEGCGAIVLRRLSDAIRDGDPVLAVIRGTSINQDGRTNTLTAPNGLAQESVVRSALENAGISPAQISYVETHGTGTALGDPIELEALASVRGQVNHGPSWVLGAVKSNIGHLEAAAGIAGLIKVVLSLQHGAIPPNLHFHSLNPHIALHDTPFEFPTDVRPWPRGGTPRFAGVSSFGFGGTNVHVVLEERPILKPDENREAQEPPFLLPLSAKTPAALGEYASAFKSILAESADDAANRQWSVEQLYDHCYASAVRRTHYPVRAGVIGKTAEDFVNGLRALAESVPARGNALTRQAAAHTSMVAFLFSGQGAQWPGMGMELFDRVKVYRERFEECDALLRRYVPWSLIDEVRASAERSHLERTDIAQPAIVAVEVALAAVWQHWGIRPGFVVGHSVGEIAAAHVAGMLTLEDGLMLAASRGLLMHKMAGHGAMVEVDLSLEETEREIARYDPRLTVAAVNAPDVTVVSGDKEAIEEIIGDMTRRAVSCRLLPVNYAFHSHQMDEARRELVARMSGLQNGPGTAAMLSTVTAKAVTTGDLDSLYWGRNLREPVRFAPVLKGLQSAGVRTFLELGPHPVLSRSIMATVEGESDGNSVLMSMRRQRPLLETMYETLAALYARGAEVDWGSLFPARGERIDLPPYQWQRTRYWITPSESSHASRAWAKGTSDKPLAGREVLAPATENVAFETVLDADSVPFLRDHRLAGIPAMPLTGFLELACEVAEGRGGGSSEIVLRNISVHRPLVVQVGAQAVVQTVLAAEERGTTIEVFGRGLEEREWGSYFECTLAGSSDADPGGEDGLEKARAVCTVRVNVNDLYGRVASGALGLGDRFQGLEELWISPAADEAFARVHAGKSVMGGTENYLFHPALLDACLQPCLAILPESDRDVLALPLRLSEYVLRLPPGNELYVHTRRIAHDGKIGQTTFDVHVCSTGSSPVATLRSLTLKRVPTASLVTLLDPHPTGAPATWCYTQEWQERPAVPSPRLAGKGSDAADRSFLLIADEEGVADAVAKNLSEGHHSFTILRHIPESAPPGKVAGVVDLDNRGAVERAVAHWIAENGLPRAGLVYFASLDAKDPELGTDSNALAALSTACSRLLHVVQGIVAATPSSLDCVWIVTRGAQEIGEHEITACQRALWGIGLTAGLEHPEVKPRHIDLDPGDTSSNTDLLCNELLTEGSDDRVAFRLGRRLVARLSQMPAKKGPQLSHGVEGVEPYRMAVLEKGTLDSIIREPMRRRVPGRGEAEIQVTASGLNFRDVLSALGMYPGDAVLLGSECAGYVVRVGEGVTAVREGDEVIAIAEGSFSSHVTVPVHRIVHRPSVAGREEAAALPIAYLTALYALRRLARINHDDRVLIHAAAGGVGLAAIRVAQAAGAEIFATAGSEEKRQFLRRLGVRHVMDSRSTEFATHVKDATSRKGVTVILNSLTGEFIPAGLEALATGGTFLEIGKRGVWSAEKVAAVRPDVTYHIIYMGDLFSDDPEQTESLFQELITGVESGGLPLLPVRVFPVAEVQEAFRTMSLARHIGKIVVTHGSVDSAKGASHVSIRRDGTYLVTGGFGGLGRVVAAWLADRGAGRIVLVSRREPSPEVLALLRSAEVGGSIIETSRADVAEPEQLERVLNRIERTGPPLRGVVHAAGVLDDAPLLQLDESRCVGVLRSKAAGAWELHQLTVKCDLDFFIMFSSAASFIGSPGQANYAAANAFLDGLASKRRRVGGHALSISWGAWSEVGMAARLSAGGRSPWRERGFLPLRPQDGVAVLDVLLTTGSSHVLVAPLAHIPASGGSLSLQDDPFWELIPRPKHQGVDIAAKPKREPDLETLLVGASRGRRRQIVTDNLLRLVARILGLASPEGLDPARGFRDLGLDSLMAVELRNALQRSLGKRLPATVAFDYPTVATMTDHILTEIFPASESAEQISGGTESPSRVENEVSQLSEEEAEAQLLKELTRKRKTDSHG